MELLWAHLTSIDRANWATQPELGSVYIPVAIRLAPVHTTYLHHTWRLWGVCWSSATRYRIDPS